MYEASLSLYKFSTFTRERKRGRETERGGGGLTRLTTDVLIAIACNSSALFARARGELTARTPGGRREISPARVADYARIFGIAEEYRSDLNEFWIFFSRARVFFGDFWIEWFDGNSEANAGKCDFASLSIF